MILNCEILVECDQCGDEERFEVITDNNGFDQFALKKSLAVCGWKLVTDWSGPKILCDNREPEN